MSDEVLELDDDPITEEEIEAVMQFYNQPRRVEILSQDGITEFDFIYDPEMLEM